MKLKSWTGTMNSGSNYPSSVLNLSNTPNLSPKQVKDRLLEDLVHGVRKDNLTEAVNMLNQYLKESKCTEKQYKDILFEIGVYMLAHYNPDEVLQKLNQ
jgi:hypothetical protein